MFFLSLLLFYQIFAFCENCAGLKGSQNRNFNFSIVRNVESELDEIFAEDDSLPSKKGEHQQRNALPSSSGSNIIMHFTFTVR
jgi:hypothetical protein